MVLILNCQMVKIPFPTVLEFFGTKQPENSITQMHACTFNILYIMMPKTRLYQWLHAGRNIKTWEEVRYQRGPVSMNAQDFQDFLYAIEIIETTFRSKVLSLRNNF